MATDLSFINAALTRTGNSTITVLNDGSPGSNIAGANYNLVVNGILTSYPWRFATKTETLALLAGAPDAPWLYAYQLPTDVLNLRVVMVLGRPIDYEQTLDKLLANYDSSYDLIAKYTWAVPESHWPPDFAEAITQQLEVLFLRGIGERYDEAEARAKSSARALQAAKTGDSKRATPRDPFVSGTLAARRGIPATTPLPWR